MRLSLKANQPPARAGAHVVFGRAQRADGVWPPLLSQTGAFEETDHMVARDGLIPYELNLSFWSDGAHKQRWMAMAEGKISYTEKGE